MRKIDQICARERKKGGREKLEIGPKSGLEIGFLPVKKKKMAIKGFHGHFLFSWGKNHWSLVPVALLSAGRSAVNKCFRTIFVKEILFFQQIVFSIISPKKKDVLQYYIRKLLKINRHKNQIKIKFVIFRNEVSQLQVIFQAQLLVWYKNRP